MLSSFGAREKNGRTKPTLGKLNDVYLNLCESMYPLTTWRRHGSWPILQPATRGAIKIFLLQFWGAVMSSIFTSSLIKMIKRKFSHIALKTIVLFSLLSSSPSASLRFSFLLPSLDLFSSHLSLSLSFCPSCPLSNTRSAFLPVSQRELLRDTEHSYREARGHQEDIQPSIHQQPV